MNCTVAPAAIEGFAGVTAIDDADVAVVETVGGIVYKLGGVIAVGGVPPIIIREAGTPSVVDRA